MMDVDALIYEVYAYRELLMENEKGKHQSTEKIHFDPPAVDEEMFKDYHDVSIDIRYRSCIDL